MAEDDDWDTDPNHVAPPDRTGSGISAAGIVNPFVASQTTAAAPMPAPTAGVTIKRAKSFDRFGGGRTKCAMCEKTVYVAEQKVVGDKTFHIDCFRCSHDGCRKLLHQDYCIQSSTGKVSHGVPS